ncbi:MAG TPA: tyrosine-type recombinase/integrase [Humibacter sp.]|nr:tyrosine-type recombinase/integrase [Humibacter sp.]
MGSVTAYETTAGKRYRVRYRKPDHAQTDKRGFRTRREAELFLASVEVKKATGEYIDPRAARIAIQDLAVGWLAAKKATLKPSSYSVLDTAWRVHVAPTWAHRQLGAIQHSEVQAWITGLASQRSATVTIRACGILAGIIDGAVRDRRIPVNPARDVGLPRKMKKKRRYLGHAQVEILAQQCGERALLVRLLAYTGLRWGEVVALRMHSIDMLRRRVLIQANAPFVAGRIEPGTPKSHEKRSVPFPAFLASPLADWCTGKDGDELLFPGPAGTYQRPPSFTRGWFQEAKKRAHRIDPSIPTDLTLHDLRHTAASLAISSGASVLSVQRMLGHASAAMTLDTYSDLFEDDLDAVAQRLDDGRRLASVGKPWANGGVIGDQNPEIC